jgi:RNA polymerase sigma-70 factor (ECF subfamily)
LDIESDLIRRAREGDEEALGSIYREYFDGVYKYAYWNTGSREEAEDISEETFYRVLKHIGGYDEAKASLRSWVMRIAHNLVVDHHRHRARHPQAELDETLAESVDIGGELEAEESRGALHKAMQELTLEQRQVLQMKYFLQMSNAEAARALGKREGAINALQHRALRRMGGLLEKQGLGRAADKPASPCAQDEEAGNV